MKKQTTKITVIAMALMGLYSCTAWRSYICTNEYGNIEQHVYLVEQYPQTILNEICGNWKKDSTFVFVYAPSKYIVPYLDMNYRDIRINYKNDATIFLLSYPFRDNPDLSEFIENSQCNGFTDKLVNEFQDTILAILIDSTKRNYKPKPIECTGMSDSLCWRFIRKEYIVYGYINVPKKDRFYFDKIIEKWLIEHDSYEHKYSTLPFHGLSPH